MNDGTEPIADEELLYRRVPLAWYSAQVGRLSDQAFAPHKERDLTGLSVSRADYKTIQEAAMGQQPGKSYYVAVLRAGDLRARGIEVVPRPQADDPGHAELPDLNAGNVKASQTLERQRMLVELCLRVEGPFPLA